MRKILAVLLTTLLVFTTFTIKNVKAEDVTLTIVWSSIDGEKRKENYVINDVSGKTIREVVNANRNTIEEYFTYSGYQPMGLGVVDVYSKENISKYKAIDEELVNDEETTLNTVLDSSKTIYVLKLKEINKINLELKEPVCGAEVTTTYETTSGSYIQTNSPTVSVADDELYQYSSAYWGLREDGYLNETIVGDKQYKAVITVAADFGYCFAEKPTANLNVGTVVSNEGSSIAGQVIAEVKAVHNYEDTYVWNYIVDEANDFEGYEVTAKKACKNNAEHIITETVRSSNKKDSITKAPTTTQEGLYTFTATFTNEAFTTQTKELKVTKTPTNLTWQIDEDSHVGFWSEVENAVGYNVQIKWEKGDESEISVPGPSSDYGERSYKDFDEGTLKFFETHKDGKYQYRVRSIGSSDKGYYGHGEWSEWSEIADITTVKVEKVLVDKNNNKVEGNPAALYLDGASFCPNENEVIDLLLPIGNQYKLEVEYISPGYVFKRYEINENPDTNKKIELQIAKDLSVKAIFEKDDTLVPVKFNFGDDHKEFAKKVYDALIKNDEYSCSIDGSSITLNWPKASSYEYYPLHYVEDRLYGIDMYDNGERFRSFGKKASASEYQSVRDYYNERIQMEENELSDSLELNAIWAKEASQAIFELEAPLCGKEIKIIEKVEEGCNPVEDFCYVETYQENVPVFTPSEDSHFEASLYDMPTAWINSKNDESYYEGKIEAGKTYTATVRIYPRIGYYEPEDIENITIIINGEDAQFIGEYEPTLVFEIEAKHDWDAPEYIWSDDNSSVTATHKCKACNEEESETVSTTSEVTIKPTATSDGEKTYTAVFTKEGFETQTKKEVMPGSELIYVVKEGENNNWYKGSNENCIFKFERTSNDELTIEMFDGIKVDGSVVNPLNNYITSKGSVVVELLPKYLETLSTGKHELTAMFIDGNDVTVNFEIKDKSDKPYIIPKTGIE